MSQRTQAESAKRLIDRLDAEAREECAAILAEAQAQAETIVAAARAQSRRKVKTVIDDLRRDAKQEVSRIRSHIETKRRQMRQRRGLSAQDRGLGQLCGTLAQLWKDPDLRKTWCDLILAEAQASLLHPDWTIEHPRGWPAREKAAFLAQVEAHTGQPPQTEVSKRATSGLIVRSDTARIDGSGEALCRDTGRLRARFQSELETMESEATS